MEIPCLPRLSLILCRFLVEVGICGHAEYVSGIALKTDRFLLFQIECVDYGYVATSLRPGLSRKVEKGVHSAFVALECAVDEQMVLLLDFQYKTITIKHTVIETSNGKEYQLFLKDTTKNKSSFRTLPLSDATVDMLLKMKQRQEKMKLLFGNRYNHEFDDYIYVFENGDLVRPNWVTACFKRLLDDNNMPHIRFHDLRHSCATLLRHQGVPMEDISKWLGHSNLLTTEQVYAHYDDMKKGTTLKALSSALDNDKDDKKEMS